MIYWPYREEQDLASSGEHELIFSGRECTDEKTGQVLRQIWFMMGKAFISNFPQQLRWDLHRFSWDLAIAWVQQQLFGEPVAGQICAAKREIILCEKSVCKQFNLWSS